MLPSGAKSSLLEAVMDCSRIGDLGKGVLVGVGVAVGKRVPVTILVLVDAGVLVRPCVGSDRVMLETGVSLVDSLTDGVGLAEGVDIGEQLEEVPTRMTSGQINFRRRYLFMLPTPYLKIIYGFWGQFIFHIHPFGIQKGFQPGK